MSPEDESDVAGGEVRIQAGGIRLWGDLHVPEGATGVVLFAHGSGSSRHSPRNRFVAKRLNDAGLGTLLFDLLTADEEDVDRTDAHLRFDIPFLARRLHGATEWALREGDTQGLRIGYFGSSTGGGAALVAAAATPEHVDAVVSRGGRPDLAADSLPQVRCPTLLIVGGDDREVLALNEEAKAQMTCPVEVAVVPGATHLFEEPGTLEQVAALAAAFFVEHLGDDGGDA